MRKGAGIAATFVVIAALVGCAPNPTVAPPAQTTQTPSTPATTASQPASPSLPASLAPQPGPGEWAAEITNPWLPFIPGTTFVYRGVEEGEKTVDTVVVTTRMKVVNGVTCTVVRDTLRSGGHVVERTDDLYAQDTAGNVWYFGEATAELNKKGKVTSTEGSWQAGVDGAQAGLFMPAAPKIGDNFYQEYYKGQAEDRYTVVSLDGTVTVPYGTFKGVLITEELNDLEPGIISQKYYASGVGQVYENDTTGPTEYGKLVKVTKK